jgi:hypothetical protein
VAGRALDGGGRQDDRSHPRTAPSARTRRPTPGRRGRQLQSGRRVVTRPGLPEAAPPRHGDDHARVPYRPSPRDPTSCSRCLLSPRR